LEHAAIASGPNLEALRNAGTESPSGRLVIDISRLRESMAATPEPTELTVIRPAPTAVQPEKVDTPVLIDTPVLVDQPQRPVFWRRSVPLGRSFTSKQQLMALAVIIAAALLVGATLALKLRDASPATEAAIVATPTPTPVPTPTPLPSPSPTVQRAAKPNPTPKKQSKGGFVNKVKRIFTKPF
jgi:hypothetical protein